MLNRSAFVVLTAGALVALCLPIGCNAVLGIDEATLRDDGTAGSSSTGGSSAGAAGGTNTGGGSGGTNGNGLLYTGTDSCVGQSAPNADCSACIASNCPLTVQNVCTADHKCRELFDNYAECLGQRCTAGDCFDRQLFTPGKKVDDCYGGCADDCATSPIYSACQLYCACMGANCANKFSVTPMNGQFTDMGDCLEKCRALPPDIVTCRRTHCELAGLSQPPTLLHCDHATGVTFCGNGTPTDRTNCTDKSLNSFACLHDSDCCSGNCNMQSACANK